MRRYKEQGPEPVFASKHRMHVNYCEICGKETHRRGRRCDLCNRILANIRVRKYASGFSEDQLIEAVRHTDLFKRFRGNSVPLRRSMAPEIPDRKNRVERI